MNYYIATRGTWAGIRRARKVRDALAAHGHTWTFDWTILMEANFAAGKRDTDLTFEEKKAYAIKDRQAVRDSQCVLYLEDEKSEGASGEFCYGDAFERVLFASCLEIPRCLFVCLADVIFKTDEELVAHVLKTYGA